MRSWMRLAAASKLKTPGIRSLLLDNLREAAFSRRGQLRKETALQ
jgi:hypothetical protein